MAALPTGSDGRPAGASAMVRPSRLLAGAGIALLGYLAGRGAFELASGWLRGHGLGAGAASLLPLPLYTAVVVGALGAAVRIGGRAADPAGALAISRRTPLHVGAGLLLAGLLVVAADAAAVGAGLASVHRAAPGTHLVLELSAYAVLYAGIALNEELVFRGTLLGLLGRWRSPALGLVASSALFAAVHVADGSGWQRLAGLFLFGALLALVRLRTRSLWPAVAAHWGFHVAAYAAAAGLPPVRIVLTGPPLLVGTPDQLDAGLLTILVLAVAVAIAGLAAQRGGGRAAAPSDHRPPL